MAMSTEIKEKKLFITGGVLPLIGTMIGVGMFGLPYAVARVGYGEGIVLLLLVAFVSAVTLRLYADLVNVRQDKARYIKVVGRELGSLGTLIAAIVYLASKYGALIAICLFGGQFLRSLLFSIFPLTPLVATISFFVIACFATIGGTLAVNRLRIWVIPTFFSLIALLSVISINLIQVDNFLYGLSLDVGSSIGVMMFAFFALAALPEMHEGLGKRTELLGKGVWWGTAVVTLVYIIFVTIIIGVTGGQTTENAILGLRNVFGFWPYILASAIAFVVSLSAYMNLASAMTNLYVQDLRWRFIPSWLSTAVVPFLWIMFGTASGTSVINITGGVLGSLAYIMMLIAYERARLSAELPKNSLKVPQWVVAMAFVIFVGVILVTVS